MLKTTPRVFRKRRSEVRASTAAIYDRYMRTRANLPNMFHTMANRPEIFEIMIAHFFDELRSHYNEGEIVELMAAIGLFNYFNRLNNALQIEPTSAGEGAE